MARSVDVLLDHLVLEGFAPSDRARLRDALEAELHRLFSERPPADAPEQARWLPGGSFSLRAGERPEAAAHRIAASLHGQGAAPAPLTLSAPPSGSEPR